MEIYNYDPITKYYLNVSTATESPLEPGVFLIPAYATEIEPPTPIDGKIPIWVDNHWELQDFESSYIVWTITGEQTEYTGNINLLSEEFTQIEPPNDNFYKWDGDTWNKDIERISNSVRRERDRKINEITWRIERHESELRQGLTPTESDISNIDVYIQELRDFPELDGFPWDGVNDPSCPWPVLDE